MEVSNTASKRLSTYSSDHVENPLDDLRRTETADTVHNDEAAKVIIHYLGTSTWTKDEETKLKRKIDRKLMVILCLTYGLQYYDKAMLGQAVSTQTISTLSRPSRGTTKIQLTIWSRQSLGFELISGY